MATQKDPQDYRIRVDNRTHDIAFTGHHLAGNSNREANGPRNTRWTELDLYRTSAGTFIFECAQISLWQGESSGRTIEMFESLDEFKDFFLAERGNLDEFEKEFLEDCGIDLIERIA